MNLVVIQGRPTRDPYNSVSAKGVIFCKIRLAVQRTYTGKEERVDYINVMCYGKLAKTMGKHLQKGQMITVRGQMFQDEWIDAIGNKRESYYCKADQITIHEWFKRKKPLQELDQFDDLELVPREIAGAIAREVDFNDADMPDYDEATGEFKNDYI